MAAVQVLKVVGGIRTAHSPTADDIRFNSIGVGVAATGTTGEIKASIRFLSGDGSLAASGFGFTTETNTGLRLAAAGDLRLVVAGVDAGKFLSSGAFTSTGSITSASGTFGTGGSVLTLNGPGGASVLNALLFSGSSNLARTDGTTQYHVRGQQTFSPASGASKFVALGVEPTINQSGTATGDYTALLVNPTETSALGTNKLLADFQVGGVSKFKVDSGGLVTVAGRITGVGAPTGVTDAPRAQDAGPAPVTTFIGVVQNTLDPNYATPGTSNANAAEANAQARAPFPCVVRSMYIDAGTGPAGDSIVFTLRKAGAGTAITATLAVSGTQASKDDGTTVTYAAGDQWSLEVNPGPSYTNSSAANVRVTLAVTRL